MLDQAEEDPGTRLPRLGCRCRSGPLAITRYVLRAEPLASAKPADVIRWIGPNVQRYLTIKLD
jgi:Tetracyclin repressor-like, C-terminal domain